MTALGDAELDELLQKGADALRNGQAGPAVRWSVPDQCPACGAKVDQAVASVAQEPVCPFCAKPLLSEPPFPKF